MHKSLIGIFFANKGNVQHNLYHNLFYKKEKYYAGAQDADEKQPFLFFSAFLIKRFSSSNMQRMLQKLPKQTF